MWLLVVYLSMSVVIWVTKHMQINFRIRIIQSLTVSDLKKKTFSGIPRTKLKKNISTVTHIRMSKTFLNTTLRSKHKSEMQYSLFKLCTKKGKSFTISMSMKIFQTTKKCYYDLSGNQLTILQITGTQRHFGFICTCTNNVSCYPLPR